MSLTNVEWRRLGGGEELVESSSLVLLSISTHPPKWSESLRIRESEEWHLTANARSKTLQWAEKHWGVVVSERLSASYRQAEHGTKEFGH
jgi:hypothetical protein